MLREPLTLAHIKPLVVGHWGTTSGQNFFYVHSNRIINNDDLDMIYIAGPGHGGPALVGNTYLEGSYSEIYPSISQDEARLKKLFTQFSFPDGISSHVAPASPGTSSRAAGVTHFPSRFTRALIANLAFRASMALTAWRSSKKPTGHRR